jgi:hypothetical protein
MAATATAVTFVTTSTQFPVGNLGPPCFVAGTRIAVPGGDVRVEDLRIGDLVETRDHGPLPLRWVGRRKVPAFGSDAPIRFAAGALGDHDTLFVSPLHCVLIDDWRAEVLFGETEVLCPAHLLVNGDTIRRIPRAEITYVHLMFDTHEIVEAEGLASESFLFGDYLCHAKSPLRAEILSALAGTPDAAPPQMTAARRVLRRHEAALLVDMPIPALYRAA